MKSTRYMKLDFKELKEHLNFRSEVCSINEEALREAVRYAPRLRGTPGYTLQIPSNVINQFANYPLVNDRYDGVCIGKFSDIAPWDEKRHTWHVYLNGTPGASIYGNGASLYQLYLKEEKEGK